jgi:hypothetical protein
LRESDVVRLCLRQRRGIATLITMPATTAAVIMNVFIVSSLEGGSSSCDYHSIWTSAGRILRSRLHEQ